MKIMSRQSFLSTAHLGVMRSQFESGYPLMGIIAFIIEYIELIQTACIVLLSVAVLILVVTVNSIIKRGK